VRHTLVFLVAPWCGGGGDSKGLDGHGFPFGEQLIHLESWSLPVVFELVHVALASVDGKNHAQA